MIIGNKNFTIPKDDSEILEHCQHINDGIQCYRNYIRNCLSSLAKQVMSVIAKNGKKMADMICKSETNRKGNKFFRLDSRHCF
jgi:hypothetical protein